METEGNVQEQVNNVKRNIKSYETTIRQWAHNEIISKDNVRDQIVMEMKNP